MSHVSNKNFKLSILLPLFKEKSSINDQVAIQNPVSALSELQIRAPWKKTELSSLKTSKNLTADFSKSINFSDTENMPHQSYTEVSHSSYPALSSKDFPNLSTMTADEGKFWDPRSKSDRRILESTEPELPGNRQREMGVSRWQKIKKQFKKFKNALSCTNKNVSEECSSIASSQLTHITKPSSLMSTSIAPTVHVVSNPAFIDNKTDSTQDRYLIQNDEHLKVETKVVDADVKTEKNGAEGYHLLETQRNRKPTVTFKRSSAEKSLEEMSSVMEFSDPNSSTVSAFGKYWDNHPISQSCRNIFRANKPILGETIIHRGRTSSWNVLKHQSVFEKQWKNKVIGTSKMMSI